MTQTATLSSRSFRTSDDVRLAYVDLGGSGTPILALHGAYGRGRSLLGLTDQLGPGYRLIALDQRGHGLSDHPVDYGREAFIADAAALIEHLDLGRAAVVGHSLGGVTGYQLAARRPDLVSAVVVVDAPITHHTPPADEQIDALPAHFPSLRALLDALAFVDEPRHFLESVVEEPEGWRFLWRAAEVTAAKTAIRGDWWDDFLSVQQPMLVVRGAHSPLIPVEQMDEIRRRRPGTECVTIDGHHDFYITHAAALGTAVRAFLDRSLA